MLHSLHRSTFLRPRERLYELVVLQSAESIEGLTFDSGSGALVDPRTLWGYIGELESLGLLHREARSPNEPQVLRITSLGRQRLHELIVDFVRELRRLHDSARQLLRRGFVPLALRGVRRIAFYPFGETAEEAFAAIDGLEFQLVAIVDDSPSRQGLRFHGLSVESPSVLTSLQPETVIVTTTVFQHVIVERLRLMGFDEDRIHTL